MKTSKFFYFTIKGDDFEPDETINLNLEGKIFRKGELFTKPYISKTIVQKTNRWVYRDELIDNSSVSKFLTKNLTVLVNHLDKLKYFIERYNTKIELVVYAENNMSIKNAN